MHIYINEYELWRVECVWLIKKNGVVRHFVDKT